MKILSPLCCSLAAVLLLSTAAFAIGNGEKPVKVPATTSTTTDTCWKYTKRKACERADEDCEWLKACFWVNDSECVATSINPVDSVGNPAIINCSPLSKSDCLSSANGKCVKPVAN